MLSTDRTISPAPLPESDLVESKHSWVPPMVPQATTSPPPTTSPRSCASHAPSQEALLPPPPPHVCVVCYDLFSSRNSFTLQICPLHFVCEPCSRRFAYIELVEHGKIELICAAGSECSAAQPASDRLLLELLGFDEFEKFKPRRNKRRAGFVCPDCGAIMVLGDFLRTLRTCTTAQCQRCQTELCLYCKEKLCEPKKKHVCALPEAQRLAKFVRNPKHNVKPCPECFTLLHRYDGCTHMTCSSPLGCRAEFCWICLTPKVLSHECRVERPPTVFSRLREGLVEGLRLLGDRLMEVRLMSRVA